MKRWCPLLMRRLQVLLVMCSAFTSVFASISADTPVALTDESVAARSATKTTPESKGRTTDQTPSDVAAVRDFVAHVPKRVCLEQLATLFGSEPDILKKVFRVADLCLDVKSVQVAAAGWYISGSIEVAGKSLDALIVIMLARDEGFASMALTIQLTGDYNLNSLLPVKTPLNDMITWHDPQIVWATEDIENIPHLPAVGKGTSIVGGIEFGSSGPFGFVGQFLDLMHLNGLQATIALPAKLANVNEYAVTASKTYVQPQYISPQLHIKQVSLTLAPGQMPPLAMSIDTILNLPGTNGPIGLMLSGSAGSLEFALMGQAKCIGTTCPSIGLAPVFPIKVAAIPELPLTVKIYFIGGSPAGFGGSGVADIGRTRAAVAFNFDPMHPTETAINGRFGKLCLNDVLNLATNLFNSALPIDVSLPGVLCISNAVVNAALQSVSIGTVTINAGLQVNGDVSLAPFPLAGSVRLSVVPPLLGQAGVPVGIFGTGELKPINIGNVVTITSVQSPDIGPTLSIQADSQKQEITLNGRLDIAHMLGGNAHIRMRADGMDATIKENIAGISATTKLFIPTKDLNKGMIDYTIEQGLAEALQGGIDAIISAQAQAVKATLQESTRVVAGACQTANRFIRPLVNIDCGQCVKSADITASLIDQVKATLKDALQKVDIERAGWRMSIDQLAHGELPTLVVDYRVFGNQYRVSFANFDVKKPQMVVPGLVQSIAQVLAQSGIDGARFALKNVQNLAAAAKTMVFNQALTCKASAFKGALGVDVRITPARLQTTSATVKLGKLCLSDLISLARMVNPALPVVAFPGVGCLSNAIISVAGSGTPGAPTLRVEGTLTIMGVSAAVHGVVSSQGIVLQGIAPRIDFKPFITLSSIDEKTGPKILFKITPTEQKVALQGMVKLSRILKNVGEMTITPTSTRVLFNDELAGLGAQCVVDLSGGIQESAQVTITLTEDISALLTENIQSALKKESEMAFGDAKLVYDAIKGKCDGLPAELEGLCDDVLSPADETLRAAQTAYDSAGNEISNLSVRVIKVVLRGTLQNLSSAMNGLVYYEMAGLHGSVGITVNMIDPSALPHDMVAQLLGSTQSVPALDQPFKQMAHAKQNLDNLLTAATQIVAHAAKSLITHAEKYAEQLGTQALATTTDAVANVANVTATSDKVVTDVASALTFAGNGVGVDISEEVGVAVSGAALASKEAQVVAQQAAAVAQEAAQTIHNVSAQVMQFAQQALSQVTEALADAAEKIGKGICKAFTLGMAC